MKGMEMEAIEIEKLAIDIQNGFEEKGLPDYMCPGVIRWVCDGVVPGAFLLAVLRNDLTNAVFQADDTNEQKIAAWVYFCYWHLPGNCWGSREKVDEWKGLKMPSHNCKWCGSGDCDAVVLCDWCYEDISEQEPEYHHVSNDFDADEDVYVRLCSKCKSERIWEI